MHVPFSMWILWLPRSKILYGRTKGRSEKLRQSRRNFKRNSLSSQLFTWAKGEP
jgi:hypothetical protein